MKKEDKKKEKKMNWWIIILVILLLLAWASHDDYKECVEHCTYLYDNSCYCYGDSHYDCSDSIDELKSCIRGCD